MKLAIAVVYMVREESERLLDVHLGFIRRTTSVPYAIYGGVNRLVPRLRGHLAARPEVVALDLPPTDARKSEEHAHYLERLLDAALADGATHVAVLHVDSFPVRERWCEELAGRLSPARPFAAAVRDARVDRKPFTAGMLIDSDFLRERRPRFLLSDAELASDEYRAYRRRFRHHPDSGVGYGFAAYRDGLDWVELARSNRGEDHCHFGSVYGDAFFHLGAAAWRRKDYPGSRGPTAALDLRSRFAGRLAGWVPPGARSVLKRRLDRAVPALDIDRKYAANEEAFRAVRDRLFADPDGYVDFLRFG